MKNMVLKVLSNAAVSKIEFTFEMIHVSPQSYKDVIKKIQDDKIKITLRKNLGKRVGEYHYGQNTLVLGFGPDKFDYDQEALIIHECTHASFDIDRKKLLVSYNEAACYVAQSMYYYYRNQEKFADGSSVTFPSDTLREAWAVAALARSKRRVAGGDVAKLLKAIAQDPQYKKKHKQELVLDGVE